MLCSKHIVSSLSDLSCLLLFYVLNTLIVASCVAPVLVLIAIFRSALVAKWTALVCAAIPVAFITSTWATQRPAASATPDPTSASSLVSAVESIDNAAAANITRPCRAPRRVSSTKPWA